MPVEFLSSDQRNCYGSFQGTPTPEQLASYFHWDDRDRKLIDRHRGEHNRLGFALQLGTVRFLGTFLTNPIDVPANVVNYVAMQLEIADANCLRHYCKRQTWWDHVSEICQLEGYLNFWTQPTHWRFIRWLYSRTWLSDESAHLLFDQATMYLVEHKILLPGVTVLERTIATIRERIQEKIWHRIARLPSSQQRQQLTELLKVDAQSQRTLLEQLRRSPTRYTSSALVETLQRFVQVQQWQIRQLDLSKIPPSRIQALARPAFT